jgi:hypothetical protein
MYLPDEWCVPLGKQAQTLWSGLSPSNPAEGIAASHLAKSLPVLFS